MPSISQNRLLVATYSSPDSAPFTVSQEVPAPASQDTSEKTRYLAVLRKASAQMQELINEALTVRMEEDKAREAEGKGVKVKGIDEAKEEDNYGEEVVEED
ncbi:gon7 family protein [Phlyctema vagabunda]|uniref:EKC/KEOPS complex subunit GON7 n=1 Tax=Phlyctema vagabunda TaxID=108571 RepID=A0ABR4PQE8_9HELO